jgi:translation initiation factor RLI1
MKRPISTGSAFLFHFYIWEIFMQPKKEFALVDYDKCNPGKCSPGEGVCSSAKACAHKVMKQIDGPFEPPMVFQDICMGCWDCIDACPLNAVQRMHIS